MHRRHDFQNVPIEILRTLVAIEDLGSVTKAAEALNLTQPAISAQMRRLENLVGVEVRKKRDLGGSQLSPEGEIVTRYARRILALNDQLLLHCRGTSSADTCRLGISIIYDGGPLKDILVMLNSPSSPQRMKFDFRVGESNELARLMAAGQIDVAISKAEADAAVMPVLTWHESLMWLCAENFLLSPGKPVPLIGWKSGALQHLTIASLERAHQPYTISFSANDWSSRLAAARAGLGYIVTTERTGERDLKKAREHYLPPLSHLTMGIFVAETVDMTRISPLLDLLAAYFSASKPVDGVTQVTHFRSMNSYHP